MGRKDRTPWVSNCVMALTHLLLVEHCKTATKGNLKHWRVEILAFRDDMGAAVDDAHVLLGEYDRNIAKAWKSARREAVQRLAEYSAQAAGGHSAKRYRRIIRAQLPEDCPYLVEHVAAYDPRQDKEPRDDIWPPGVARVFNRILGTDYEILPGSDRRLPWERQGSRGGSV